MTKYLKTINIAMLLSFFFLPIIAWGPGGAIYSFVTLILFIAAMEFEKSMRGGIILLGTCVIAMVIVATGALHSLMMTAFLMSGICSWFVPGIYLTVFVLMVLNSRQ